MSGSLWSLALPAAVGLGSAYLGSQAQQKATQQAAGATQQAADATLQANRESLDFLRQGRDMARGDLAPYRDAGLADYGAFRGQVGTQFQESPGYQFAVQEGINAIDRGASARGMLNSGARLKELTRYGAGMANQEYGNWLNRLQGLAGVGQTATGQSASLAANAGGQAAGINQAGGNTLANLIQQGGATQAQGTVGAANTALQGAAQGVNLYALMNPSWGSVTKRPGEP